MKYKGYLKLFLGIIVVLLCWHFLFAPALKFIGAHTAKWVAIAVADVVALVIWEVSYVWIFEARAGKKIDFAFWKFLAFISLINLILVVLVKYWILIPSIALLELGSLSNMLVIKSNGGYMPAPKGDGERYIQFDSNTKLPWLGDWIRWFDGHSSPGDLLMLAGFFWSLSLTLWRILGF